MFSRLFGKDDGSVCLQSQRKRQIDTLKVFNQNVAEIQHDSEYQVSFTAGAHNMALCISLLPGFPVEKPVIKVTPPVQHPWVTDQCVVSGAPGLIKFTMHSDLGRVVQAIIREFEKHPPTLVGTFTNQNLERKNNLQSYDQFGLPRTNGVAGYDFPPVPLSFPELDEMSVSELQELNDSEDVLMDFLEKLPQIKKVNRDIEQLVLKNEEIAKENLLLQPSLEKQKQEVLETVDHVTALKQKYEDMSQQFYTLAEKYTPSNIQANLKLAAVQAEEESEQVAERFLDGKMDVDEFLQQYIDNRMVTHSRKAKEEKLHQQLMHLQRAGF